MAAGAQLSVTDMRRASRHPVDYTVIAEHLMHGDVKLHVTNISAHGFMIEDVENIGRGDRLIIRLPAVGRIEAYCIWLSGDRAGFQFERILRLEDFQSMIGEMQPNPALRGRR